MGIMTTTAVVDGIGVRMTSGHLHDHEWCAIGQVAVAYDGVRIRVALLCVPVVPMAVRRDLALASAYGRSGHSSSARQRAVVDLRDSGVGAYEIARRLGLHPEMVRGVLRRHDRRALVGAIVPTLATARCGDATP
jgi:DNA-binding CsgD family transcriptional regulator